MNAADRKRFWTKVKKTSTCWLWQSHILPSGYGQFWLDGRARPAHRVAYENLRGAIPKGMLACHKCDVRDCVRPFHLFVDTDMDNTRDAARKGRLHKARGSRAGSAKLTKSQVRRIKKLLLQGVSQREIARRFNLRSYSTIWWIAHGHTWRHVA